MNDNNIPNAEPPLVENPLDDPENPVHDLNMLAELVWHEQEQIAVQHDLPDEFIWLISNVVSKAQVISQILHSKFDTFQEQAKAANVVTIRPR